MQLRSGFEIDSGIVYAMLRTFAKLNANEGKKDQEWNKCIKCGVIENGVGRYCVKQSDIVAAAFFLPPFLIRKTNRD